MANKGTIKGRVSYNAKWFDFYVEWSSKPNLLENYSDVTIKSYIHTNNTAQDFDTDANRTSWIQCIGGLNKDKKDTTYLTKIHRVYWSQVGNPYLIQEATFKVPHNADGTKTITINAYADMEAYIYGADNCDIEATSIELDTIPRASSVTANDVTIGQSTTITIKKALPSFTSTIMVGSTTIATKSAETSFTHYVDDSYYQLIPNATSGKEKITCITYNGAVEVGRKTTEYNYYINELASKPTINPLIYDVNPTTINLTGNQYKLVKYLSDAETNIQSSARNGASIVANYVKNGNNEQNTSIGSFPKIENGIFDFWTKDSRGLTTEDKIQIELVPYVRLTCDLEATINPATNEATLEISGNFFNDSFGAIQNDISLQYRYKLSNSEVYSDWFDVYDVVRKSGNRYSCDTILQGFDYLKKYDFQAKASDVPTYVESNVVAVNTLPIAEWDADHFKLNVKLEGIEISATSIKDSFDNTDLTLRISEGDAFRPIDASVLAQWNGYELTYLTKDELVNAIKDNFKNYEVIWTGELYGGKSITIPYNKQVKRYLDIYFNTRLGTGEGRQLLKYTIDTTLSTDNIKSYSAGVGIAYDTESGLIYFSSECYYLASTKTLTHSRCGYFKVSDGTYTNRNNSAGYYVYQVVTHD